MIKSINSKMSVGMRLGLVSGLFVAASALPAALLIGRANSEIDFSRKEQSGVDFLEGAWSATLRGGALDASLAESAFSAGDAAKAFQDADTDAERIEKGAALIAAVADGSNLTLDPELDSFYAMDAATVRIPAFLKAAFELEAAVAADGDPARRQTMIEVASDHLLDSARAVQSSMNAAASNEKTGATKKALDQPGASLVEAAEAMVAAAREGANASASFEGARSASDAAWKATAEELSRLLQVRVANKQSELMVQLALVALFLAAAGGLAWLVTSGLGRRFGALTAAMERLRAGEFDVEIPHRDDSNETGSIATTLDVLRGSIVERNEAAARALEESQLGAEGLFKAVSRAQAVIEFAPDGVILTANENFLRVMGYALDEIVGKHHSMFIPPEEARGSEYRAFWGRLSRNEFVSDKFLRVGKGGKEVWIQASYNPIADKAGKVVKVVKIATDVTTQEQQNLDFSGQLAAIGKSQAVIEFRMDGTVLTANENFCNTLGYSLEEIRGQHHSMFAEPAYRQSGEYRAFWDRLNRGEFDAGKYKRIGKGGKEIWIQASYNPIFDHHGKPFKVVKYATDITAEMMRNADYEGQLQAISKSQAVIEFGLDGRILTANENFLMTLGYSLQEIVGKHHSMFCDPEYARSSDYRAFWERLGRGEFASDKFRRLGKGGKEIWIQASYNPILDPDGKPFKIVKFASDVTQVENDRRAAEAERAARAEEQAQVVRGLADGLSHLAEGDLTSRITRPFPGEYEQLRTDFNSAMDSLQDAMKTIVVNAGGIRTGAGEISQAADDLSRRTEQQAASLEETAAALDEITATVRKTADGAKQANSVVNATRSDAESSGKVVQDTVAAMAEIEKSSKQISQIIGVIDEIAFQTNLLALNAGVEAARAGEAGRGFAVVASEVRALAQRSSEAAKEIKGLISASSQHVETGVDLVNEAGKALQVIVEKVSEISGLVSEIAASAHEQSTALAEVNTAINQMDQVTQQNAAMVEESTAASHSLTNEADELMGLIARFQTGAAVASAPTHAKPKSRPAGQTIAQQQKRVTQFATSGAAAVKVEEDWQEF